MKNTRKVLLEYHTEARVVTQETYTKICELIEADKPEKPKFEPIEIHAGCFVVSVSGCNNVVVKTGPSYNNKCYQCIFTVDKFNAALQSSKAFVEVNK